MCGIAGSINLPLDATRVHGLLHHRGPDGQGSVTLSNVQLLHTRLSIVDAQGGAQPMRRGPYTITYNGEIYNHLELRERHGLHCVTDSDTETLLAMVERFGHGCLAQLDGMFAFALHDARTGSVWLARDRAGEKPLYLWQRGNQIAFASELNTLAAIVHLDIDDGAIGAFLASGINFRQRTPYREVVEIEAGTSLLIDTTSLSQRSTRWFSMQQCYASAGPSFGNESDAVAHIDELLHTSIQRRLLSSDLEVGSFLSGGIDSGLVSAIATQYVPHLKTFTVSFAGQFDEAPLARQVADRYQTEHRVLRVEFNKLHEHIEDIVGNYGEPVCDDSIIPVWYVNRAAKEHVSVVLTGDGADELFGGYRRYVPYAHRDLFQCGTTSNSLLQRVSSRLPVPGRKASAYNYGWRLLNLLGCQGIERYLASTTMLNGRFLLDSANDPALVQHHDQLATSGLSGLQKLMIMDFDTLLAGGLLPKMDIGSMAHSLEARSPFLSSDLLAAAASLPDSMKIHGRQTKHLLRQLSARYLPQTVTHAPKRGFETPLLEWVDGRLRDSINDYLRPSSARVRDWYRRGVVDELLEGTLPVTPLLRARMLWTLFCTEVWFQRQTVRQHALMPAPAMQGLPTLAQASSGSR